MARRCLDGVVVDADVACRPLAVELGPERGQFADGLAQSPVSGLATGFGAHQCDSGHGGGIPADEQSGNDR
jgi:hypothetical protein